jgi:hypothetical protein
MSKEVLQEVQDKKLVKDKLIDVLPKTRIYLIDKRYDKIKSGNKGFRKQEMIEIFKGKKCTTKNY